MNEPVRLAYLELAGPAEYEEKIQRSVFIGRAEPCHSEAEARELLNRVRAEHRDATHNCWAYRLGPESVTEYSSDDGEPSGTAGRPILSKLRGKGPPEPPGGAIRREEVCRGLFNVIVVVTRYFGGVKLGVRGLIEAYGGVAARTLNAAETVECVPVLPVAVRLPWAAVGTVTRLLEGNGAGGLAWDYGGEGTASPSGVSVTAHVPCASLEALAKTLDSLRAQGVIEDWAKTDGRQDNSP